LKLSPPTNKLRRNRSKLVLLKTPLNFENTPFFDTIAKTDGYPDAL